MMNDAYIFVDPVMTCPYDKNHRIAKSRIQKHIVKCEKNFPDDYKEVCPYDATHRLFKHEMQEHITRCPMRRLLQPELYQRVKKQGSIIKQPVTDMESMFDPGESWDGDDDSSWRNSVIGGSIVNGKTSSRQPYHNAGQSAKSGSKMGKGTANSGILRSPLGYSEAIMLGDTDKSGAEDMESVFSQVGLGRGSMRPNHAHLLKKYSLGRGRGAT